MGFVRKKSGESGAAIWIFVGILVCSAGLLNGCSNNAAEQPSATNETAVIREMEERESVESTEDIGRTETIETDSGKVSDIVRQQAEQFVEDRYLAAKQSGDSYIDWRIESLTHSYTYEDFEGMVLQVYQLNYEFLSDSPEKIQLVGGMSVDEDGWIVVSYPNSDFFLYQEEGDTLTYLGHMFANDCLPGDETFTSDLRKIYSTGDWSAEVGH